MSSVLQSIRPRHIATAGFGCTPILAVRIYGKPARRPLLGPPLAPGAPLLGELSHPRLAALEKVFCRRQAAVFRSPIGVDRNRRFDDDPEAELRIADG